MLAEEIVEKILEDLRDRRGFRGLWESLDWDVKNEIRLAWAAIVQAKLQPAE